MPPFIHTEKCKKCHLCVEACQSDVFYNSVHKEIPTVTYPDECWHCNACVIVCSADAVEIRLPLVMQPVFKDKE